MARRTHDRDAGPINALDAAREAFLCLTAGEHPVTVDGALFDHLPNREIRIDEVRRLLLAPACPRRVWDQVWAHVIARARLQGGTWMTVAVGLALPMLTSEAARWDSRSVEDRADLHAEILRGFIEALHDLDLASGRIAVRLRWAAFRAGRQAARSAQNAPRPLPKSCSSHLLKPPAGNPDLVLVRAVRDGVISQTEAELISATRLNNVPLTEVSRPQGMGYEALRSARRRAEIRLVAWLTDTEPSSGARRTAIGRADMRSGTPGAAKPLKQRGASTAERGQ